VYTAGDMVGRKAGGTEEPGAVARAFHDATKHSVQSVRLRGHSLRWDNKPNPFKVISGSHRIDLPGRFPPARVPVLEAVHGSTAPAAQRSPGLVDLARLLVLGAGVRRRVRYADGEEFFFRTYASAGALYPVEIYPVCSSLGGLGAGVYHFEPRGAALVRLREGDHRRHLVRSAGADPALAEAPITLVLTGIPWRTTWKYTERGYRHLFWDAGMILANLLSLASAAALPARLILGFLDDAVGALLGLDQAREFPLCLLTVGSGSPGEPAEPPLEPLDYPFPPLSPREVDYPSIGEVNDAGRLASPEAVREWRGRIGPQGAAGAAEAAAGLRSVLAPPPDDSIEDVIRRRGSARRFRRSSMPAGVLASVLEAAMGHVPTDLGSHNLTDVYLVANAVDGLDPGAYSYGGGSFELLRQGDYRREAAFLCLEQRLAGDAAVTLFLLLDLERVLRTLGDRGYRAAQLEAGIVAGRIYLGAYGYAYGATGLTFYDDEVTAFFSPHAADKSCMLVVAVGESMGRSDLRPVR
jgi:SagB-type dehydrogenase family enzyme